MNLKKILSGVVAGAMAVSAMAVAAFAEAEAEKKTVTVDRTADFYLMLGLSTDQTGPMTVTWTTEAADETYEGSKDVESLGNWWQTVDITVADICGDLDPADVTGVTFKSPVKYKVGYVTTVNGGWAEEDVAVDENNPEGASSKFTDICLAPYSYKADIEVNTFVSGEFEAGTDAGSYAAVVYNAAGSETQDAALTIKDDDVIVASVVAPEGVDTSEMVISLKGYTSEWGGWKDVTSEPGALSLETTVKAIREANGLENAEDLFGVNLEITGLADGAKVTFSAGTTVVVTLTDKPADPEESTAPETSPEETDAPVAGTGDTNQPTGIAIAFVPAVLAATGVIVAKKRK